MKRHEVEAAIARKCVRIILQSGYKISVYDGEEWALKRSSSFSEITSAMFSTEADLLVIRDNADKKIGSVYLVHGNGSDIVSDYSSDNLEYMELLLEPVSIYADKLAMQHNV